MKPSQFACWLVLLLIIPSASVTASGIPIVPAGDSRRALTVDECVDIGLTYSKSLYGSLMGVRNAEAKVGEATARRLPALKMQAVYTRLSSLPPFEIVVDIPTLPQMKFTVSDSIVNSTSLQLTLQQPLFTGFALESLARVARLSASAARQNYIRDQNELAYAIQNGYWQLVRARELSALLDESVQMIESHHQDVRRLFDQGLVKNNDVLKVQVQLANSKVSQLEAANGVRLATMSLASLLGLSLDTEIEPTSLPEATSAALDEAGTAVEQALRERPEMKAVADQIAAAQAGLRAARSGYFPHLFLVGNYVYANPNTRIQPIQTKFRDTWDVSLALSFDLWNNRGTMFQVRQAHAQLEQAKAGQAQLRDGIVLEVRKSQYDLQQALQRIDLAADAVRQAEENYRITHERFQAGLTTNSELLDAEVFLLQSKVSRTEALIGFAMARAQLKKSLGAGKVD
jgi:outer membrane protein TolC